MGWTLIKPLTLSGEGFSDCHVSDRPINLSKECQSIQFSLALHPALSIKKCPAKSLINMSFPPFKLKVKHSFTNA